jgi:hexosaminidase
MAMNFARLPLLACIASVLAAAGVSQQSDSHGLMPLPAHMTDGQGQLLIDGGFNVAIAGTDDTRVRGAKVRFMAMLGKETGIPFGVGPADPTASLTISAAGPSDKVGKVGEDESYHLEITPQRATLTAPNALGVMHGLQTFLQLVHATPQGFAVPSVTIDDQPRFPWRGLMIDAGRHFQPLEVIERNLDGMEAVKLNVLHWHLSEDQGFRIESKVFPQLTAKGSNGQYYTQKQAREVIDYAYDRGIRVVPEFDMPCHTTAWFVGYPELASGKGPYQIETKWGIFDPGMDPSRESTFAFLDKFIGEMTALFPDAYFHIGGDECNGKEWDANAKIKQFMQAHNLKDDAALQSYFTGRVQKLVTSHHKITVGWDEVLQPDTPRDVVIQSWRGATGLAAAARQGNRVLLSNGYYIDLNQPASEHYLVDPFGGEGATLSAEQKALVLGGEATMWSEFVTPDNIDSRIWPRTAAIAERFWSPQDVRDVESMYRRMAMVSQKLEYDGLTHRSFTRAMLERMSNTVDVAGLEVLASAVQPPKGYDRESLKEYGTGSALNRLVDAVPPESEPAREFNELAQAIADGKATDAQLKQARTWLTLWRDNDAKLEPSLAGSEITAELAPLSKSLSQVAAIGLEALDDLKNHTTVPADLKLKNETFLKAAEKPQAVLLDKVAPSVDLLWEATGSN